MIYSKTKIKTYVNENKNQRRRKMEDFRDLEMMALKTIMEQRFRMAVHDPIRTADEFAEWCVNLSNAVMRKVKEGSEQMGEILTMDVYEHREYGDDGAPGTAYSVDYLRFSRYCSVTEAKKAIIGQYGVKSDFVIVGEGGNEVYRAKVNRLKESGDLNVYIYTL